MRLLPPAPAPQLDDLYTFVGVVEQRVGGRLPASSTFLGGQSMGGLVAALGALRCQERWAGLIIFSGAMGVVWTLVLRCGACAGQYAAVMLTCSRRRRSFTLLRVSERQQRSSGRTPST
jgi:alpha-beta hydrolase superfamily lysophospholipase